MRTRLARMGLRGTALGFVAAIAPALYALTHHSVAVALVCAVISVSSAKGILGMVTANRRQMERDEAAARASLVRHEP